MERIQNHQMKMSSKAWMDGDDGFMWSLETVLMVTHFSQNLRGWNDHKHIAYILTSVHHWTVKCTHSNKDRILKNWQQTLWLTVNKDDKLWTVVCPRSTLVPKQIRCKVWLEMLLIMNFLHNIWSGIAQSRDWCYWGFPQCDILQCPQG